VGIERNKKGCSESKREIIRKKERWRRGKRNSVEQKEKKVKSAGCGKEE
jgi:hypothetical protein